MEYLILIVEFFYVKGIRAILWYLSAPIVVGLCVFWQSESCNYADNAAAFVTNIVTVLSILIGFTISTLTLLLTVSSPDIEKAKTKLIDKKIFEKEISLFDSILIGLAYVILIQGLLLLGNFLYPIFIDVTSLKGRILFSINISFTVHVILILMRNILDFYFVITRR